MLESEARTADPGKVGADVPRKLPIPGQLHKLKDTAVGAVKDPLGTSGRLFGQAKEAATLGRHLAEGLASSVAEQVGTRTRGRRATDAPHAASPAEAHVDTHASPSSGPRQVQGDPLAKPTHPAVDAPSAEPVPSTEARVSAKKASPADVAKKAAKKAPAKKTSAKKAPAKKSAAKKTAEKSTGDAAALAPDAPGDKLPPRAPDSATVAPAPPPAVEPNPEATPPA